MLLPKLIFVADIGIVRRMRRCIIIVTRKYPIGSVSSSLALRGWWVVFPTSHRRRPIVLSPRPTPSLHHRNALPLVLFVVHELARGRHESSLDPVILHEVAVDGGERSLCSRIHSDFVFLRPLLPPVFVVVV